MPAKSKPAKKFMVVAAAEGRAAVNLDLISKVAFVTPLVPGLVDERKRLRLSFSGAYCDIEDEQEQARVLDALGLEAKDLAEQEVSV